MAGYTKDFTIPKAIGTSSILGCNVMVVSAMSSYDSLTSFGIMVMRSPSTLTLPPGSLERSVFSCFGEHHTGPPLNEWTFIRRY